LPVRRYAIPLMDISFFDLGRCLLWAILAVLTR
jgi:hypothetical protein